MVIAQNKNTATFSVINRSIAVAQLMQVCSAAPAIGVQAQETMSWGQPEAYVSGMSGNTASSWEIRPKFI
jgi:hypothetical protein